MLLPRGSEIHRLYLAISSGAEQKPVSTLRHQRSTTYQLRGQRQRLADFILRTDSPSIAIRRCGFEHRGAPAAPIGPHNLAVCRESSHPGQAFLQDAGSRDSGYSNVHIHNTSRCENCAASAAFLSFPPCLVGSSAPAALSNPLSCAKRASRSP